MLNIAKKEIIDANKILLLCFELVINFGSFVFKLKDVDSAVHNAYEF
jgi:hypothetical protein